MTASSFEKRQKETKESWEECNKAIKEALRLTQEHRHSFQNDPNAVEAYRRMTKSVEALEVAWLWSNYL